MPPATQGRSESHTSGSSNEDIEKEAGAPLAIVTSAPPSAASVPGSVDPALAGSGALDSPARAALSAPSNVQGAADENASAPASLDRTGSPSGFVDASTATWPVMASRQRPRPPSIRGNSFMDRPTESTPLLQSPPSVVIRCDTTSSKCCAEDGSPDHHRTKTLDFEAEDEDCCCPSVDRETMKPFFILLALVAVISSGVIVSMHLEGWEFLTAMYVVVQILTTVGYGDFAVTHDAMRLFLCGLAVIGLCIMTYTATYVSDHLHKRKTLFLVEQVHTMHAPPDSCHAGIPPTPHQSGRSDRASDPVAQQLLQGQRESEHIKEIKKEVATSMQSPLRRLLLATVPALIVVAFGTVFYALYEPCTCSYGKAAIPECREDEGYDTCVETGGYVKTWASTFYMSVITLTTVGIGDFTPRTKLGRALAIPWMLIGVWSMAHWLNELANFFFERDLQNNVRAFHLNRDTFDAMDKDKSGTISRAEYRGFVLVQHGIVHQEVLDCIDKQYDALDDFGTEEVTFEMIDRFYKRARRRRKMEERQTRAASDP